MRSLSTDSLFTYLFMAFIAMTGLSYINYLPGVVNTLANGLGFSAAQAGQVVAINGYGGLLGSSCAIFLIGRIKSQQAMFMCLLVLGVVDMSTLWIADYSTMLAWRFVAGAFGGLCVGIGFSVLARMNNPDRGFGFLLFVQFSIGSLVIYILPWFEILVGVYAVFFIMASFVFISLVLMLFVPKFRQSVTSSSDVQSRASLSSDALLVLLAVLCYQIAASGIWAYVGLIGRAVNIADSATNTYIAATGMLGLLGAMLPIFCGKRFGRLLWIIAGTVLSTLAALLLSYSQLTALYVTAMALLFFCWPAVLSFLLAVTAQLDTSGRLATMAAVISSVGLATGPLLASALLDNNGFATMLYASAAIFVLSLFLLFRPVRAQEASISSFAPLH